MKVTESGQILTCDALDRLLTRTYPADSSLNVSLTYDQAGHGSGIGRLTSATDQAGSLSLSYDQRGLVIANNRTISGTSYDTGYSYESAGRLSSITYPTAGWTVNYARDSAGRIITVTGKPPASPAVNLASSITRMPYGPITGFTYGNGIINTRTYDLDYRMTSIKDAGTGNIQYSSYTYNANDNITGIADNVTPANSQTLTYDLDNRLASASGSYGTISSITYDSGGNRLTYGGTSYTIPGTSNRMSNAGGSSISYSSTGNITAIGTTPTFTYNKANRMATAILSGTTSAYVYGYDGLRLKATVGAGTPNVFSYDQSGNLLTETNSGTETDYVYLDGFPVAAIQPGASTVSALLTDHLGTPQFGTDASKATVWSCNYDPNGRCSPAGTITQNLRFPGQYADATGFYHNGYRNYNPNYATGAPRYLESDLIGLDGGINTYVYAGNNPGTNIDPWGLIEYPNNTMGPLPAGDYWTSQMTMGKCGQKIPPAPPNVDINANMAIAVQHSYDVLWFYNQVRSKGPWDYKQQGSLYQDFGNFNFGATGTSFGFPQSILDRGAGWAQEHAGTSTPQWGTWFEGVPYGDDPADQIQINNGIDYSFGAENDCTCRVP